MLSLSCLVYLRIAPTPSDACHHRLKQQTDQWYLSFSVLFLPWIFKILDYTFLDSLTDRLLYSWRLTATGTWRKGWTGIELDTPRAQGCRLSSKQSTTLSRKRLSFAHTLQHSHLYPWFSLAFSLLLMDGSISVFWTRCFFAIRRWRWRDCPRSIYRHWRRGSSLFCIFLWLSWVVVPCAHSQCRLRSSVTGRHYCSILGDGVD